MAPHVLARLILASDDASRLMYYAANPFGLGYVFDLLFWFWVTVLWFQAWSARWQR